MSQSVMYNTAVVSGQGEPVVLHVSPNKRVSKQRLLELLERLQPKLPNTLLGVCTSIKGTAKRLLRVTFINSRIGEKKARRMVREALREVLTTRVQRTTPVRQPMHHRPIKTRHFAVRLMRG